MAFNQVVREVAPGRFEVRPEFARDFKLVTREDLGGIYLSMRAETDHFYLNEGGTFRRVALDSERFLDPEGRRMTQVEESFGLGARFADLNADGAPDLYVVNDFEDPDQFWINDGQGRFRLTDWTVQRQMSNSGMAVDVADVNGDGLPDMYEVDMLGNDSRSIRPSVLRSGSRRKKPAVRARRSAITT